MKAYFNFNHGVPAEAGFWLEYTVKLLSCTKPHVKKLFFNTIRTGSYTILRSYNGLTRWGHYELPAHFLGTIFLVTGTCLIPWQDQVSVPGFSPMVSCNFSVKSALWQQQSPCKDRARQPSYLQLLSMKQLEPKEQVFMLNDLLFIWLNCSFVFCLQSHI